MRPSQGTSVLSPANRGRNNLLERTTSYGRRIDSPVQTPKAPERPVTPKGSNDVSSANNSELSSTKEYLQALRNNVNRSRLLVGQTMSTVSESETATASTKTSATSTTASTGVPYSSVAARQRRTIPNNTLETVGDTDEESLASSTSTEKKTEVTSITSQSDRKLQDELAASKELNKKQELEIKKLQLELERLGKNNGVWSSASASDSTELKKKIVVLAKRAQSAEQARDALTEKFKDYEQEKLETSKILEMAEQAYQNLQSQNTSLTKEIEIYKQNSKSTNSAASAETSITIRKLQDQNTELETKIKELTAELEKEKTDQSIVIAELKAKVILLETNAKTNAKMDITQKLSNLPSHPKKEMADARAEIVAKDKKISQLEASLEDIHNKSALLADQLNRMCDEVEKGEKVVARMETITKENETLKHENANLTSDLDALKEELQQKEKEILTLFDDNDKMVAKLITLGYQVQVEDDSALTFTTVNANLPATTSKADPLKNTKDKKETNNNNFKVEDLSGLSIDELLNG